MLNVLPFVHHRHILAAVHFNFNLQREVKHKESDGTERVRISYPKFKNGEATVRNVTITPNFGKCKFVGDSHLVFLFFLGGSGAGRWIHTLIILTLAWGPNSQSF